VIDQEWPRVRGPDAGPLSDLKIVRERCCAQAHAFCLRRRYQVGQVLARALIETAKVSEGTHHSEAYQLQVKHTC
jgi:hypothetical protein